MKRLRYSVLGYSSDNTAAMLENVVYLELLRRGYEVTVGKLDTAEIDFVAMKQENKLYIQVAQEIGSAETEKREFGKLLDIRDNYPKYVLRTDIFAGGNAHCGFSVKSGILRKLQFARTDIKS